MKGFKSLLQIGAVISGLGLLLLAYNFFNMYSIAGKCPESVDAQPCAAYDSWATLNKVGLVLLAVGVVAAVIGLVSRRQN